MLVKTGLKLGKKIKTEKEKGALDNHFCESTSENAINALEEPSHSEDDDNAGGKPVHVMSDGQSGSLCTRSEKSFRNRCASQRKKLIR